MKFAVVTEVKIHIEVTVTSDTEKFTASGTKNEGSVFL
jgi:hypothetical protein